MNFVADTHFSGGLQTVQKLVQKLQKFLKNVKKENSPFLFLPLSLLNLSVSLKKNAFLLTLKIFSKEFMRVKILY